MQRPDPARFANSVAALIGRPLGSAERIAVAVSGGPDSLALLLLASEAFGSRVCALTVDHGLRAEATAEAAYVADICSRLGIGHVTLKLEWPDLPTGNVQAVAREARYTRMGGWCLDHGIAWLATAHHCDDQAETLLMRLSRGSGLAGLAGVRAKRPLSYRGGSQVTLLRPLLDWCRTGLAGIVQAAGITAIDDPTNRNQRYDRTRARQLLAATPWLQSERLATAAHHLADANDALEWVTRMAWRGRAVEERDGSLLLDVAGLPHEITRRLVLEAIDWIEHDAKPRGPDVERLIERLMAGKACTLAGVKASGGPVWRFTWAPKRKSVPSSLPEES